MSLTVPLAAAPPALRQRLLFAVLCLVWGTTWLAMKTGVDAVPPGFFSGTRWTVAGLILIGWRWSRGAPIRVPPRLWGRVLLVAVLMIVVSAIVQLYGLRQIGSGLGSVLTSSVTPVGLLGFSVMLGEERFSRRQVAAIFLGLAGLLVLFGPAAWAGDLGASQLFGAAGVLAGCLAYCAGSVLARPIMRSVAPAQFAALTNLIGGIILLVLSLLFEPGATRAASLDWGVPAWTAWWFLLLPGSLGATIIYFMLVRDWGASRTGTYAFVSPVISVLLGMAVYAEPLHPADAAGMALMLAGAGVALRRT